MSNVVTMPTSWAASRTRQEINRQRQDTWEAYRCLLDLPQWSDLEDLFRAQIGEALKPWQLVELASMALPIDMIKLAIGDTLRAPRPSYYYLRAILWHCKTEGVTTFRGYLDRNQAHKDRLDSLASALSEARAAL